MNPRTNKRAKVAKWAVSEAAARATGKAQAQVQVRLRARWLRRDVAERTQSDVDESYNEE